MIDNLKLLNKQTGNTLLMDMDNADYLLYEGGIDWGTANVTHNTYNYTSRLGEYATSTVVSTRDISISGWIIGKNNADIYRKKETLINVVNPLQDLRVEYGDYGIDAKAETHVSFSNTYKENNDVMCKFLIQLLCPFPFFTKNSDNIVMMSDIISIWHFPWVLTENDNVFSKYQSSRFQTILNEGMVDVGVKVTMEASGDVNNPTVYSVTNQEQMRINKKLVSGEKVVISSQSKRYVEGTLNGETQSYLDYFDYDNVWMLLNQGNNVLTIKTFDDDGVEDDTYKNLEVYLEYNPCTFNLKEA